MKQDQKKKLYIAGAICAAVCIAFFGIIATRKPKAQNTTPSSLLTSGEDRLSDDEVEKLPGVAPEIKISEDSPLGKARAKNIDAVAWLQIPGTEIDNAVMQAPNNEYYLFRDETGQKSQWGSYFADYYANLASPDSLIQNTVLYGHTENKDNPNGQRFSQLFKFTNSDFLNKNRTLYLTVGESKLTFEVFAVFYADTEFYYIDPAPSDQGFDTFMHGVNARNEYVFDGMNVTEQDKLLTLSGCSHKYDVNKTGNHRIVVMAKLIPGDAVSGTAIISQNPSPLRPQP